MGGDGTSSWSDDEEVLTVGGRSSSKAPGAHL